jgi:hypothetical protein
VYALTTAGRGAVRVRGLEGEPLAIVPVGRVAAIVGELPRVPTPTHDRLTRYDAVMRRLSRRYASLLPARFATCVDRDELVFILRSRQAFFRRALRAVRFRAQMTMRFIDIDRAPAAPPTSASRRSGTEYLRQRSPLATIPAIAPVLAAMKKWVRDERVETHDRIVTVYHLIPRGAAETYRRAVIERAERAGLRAIVSGPFPPYAFTEW